MPLRQPADAGGPGCSRGAPLSFLTINSADGPIVGLLHCATTRGKMLVDATTRETTPGTRPNAGPIAMPGLFQNRYRGQVEIVTSVSSGSVLEIETTWVPRRASCPDRGGQNAEIFA